MARDENAPFPRGSTFYDGGTIDANDLAGVNLEGMEFVFEDIDPSSGVQRSERPVRCRIVRNSSGITLLGKRLASFVPTAGGGEHGCEIGGYTNTTAGNGYLIDEYLPSSGVPNNDLCWIVIEGPAVGLTAAAADAQNVINVGSFVCAGETQAASTAASTETTAGRLVVQLLTGTTAPLANMIQNRVGRALSARTTANTNVDILVDVGHW